jgi:hypothetical protein
MEGQQKFSLSVDTFIERHVNVEELFNFSWLHVDNMAGILKDLDLVGSTTGLTIQNIKDQYGDYSVESTFVWVTWWVVVALTILGLGGIFWSLRKRFMKAKKDHRPLLKQFRDLFFTDTQPRDQEMQERGDTDSDKNKDFIPDMVPDDMRRGPIAHAPLTWVTLLVVLVTSYVQRHRSETIKQMSIGTSSPPQRVPLVAPCPVTNLRIKDKLKFYIYFLE